MHGNSCPLCFDSPRSHGYPVSHPLSWLKKIETGYRTIPGFDFWPLCFDYPVSHPLSWLKKIETGYCTIPGFNFWPRCFLDHTVPVSHPLSWLRKIETGYCTIPGFNFWYSYSWHQRLAKGHIHLPSIATCAPEPDCIRTELLTDWAQPPIDRLVIIIITTHHRSS